jgi:hypothetical protein
MIRDLVRAVVFPSVIIPGRVELAEIIPRNGMARGPAGEISVRNRVVRVIVG